MKTIKKDLYDRDFEEYIKTLNYEGKRILDVGCGEGYKTLYFDSSKNELYGADLKDRRVELAKKTINFAISEQNTIPFADAMFDVVSNFDVIEHALDDALLIAEIYRVLKKGGVVLTFTPNLNRLSNKITELVTHKKIRFPRHLGFDEGLEDCTHQREYSKDTLSALFNTVGFSEIIVENYWFGLRFPVVEQFRIKKNIPHVLAEYSQYIVAVCTK